MTDLRKRLRPLLHCGMPFKVKSVLDEIIARDDPALYDWVLEAVYVADLAHSEFWRWRYDDTQEFRHPSLESDQVLRLVAHGNSALAARLRSAVKHLGIELGLDRRREPFFDVSAIGRMSEATKLRVIGVMPPSVYEWRAELAAGEPKPLTGFASIAGMAALEHLTILAGAGVELAPLVRLSKLRHVELVACDIADPTPLASTSIETLVLAACSEIVALDALPPTLRHLRVEDLPSLASIDGVLTAPALETLEIAGVPLAALPDLPSSVNVTFQPVRPRRTAY